MVEGIGAGRLKDLALLQMAPMQITDLVGYAAATLVLATFYMRSMRALRWLAIASNLAFIAYAYLAHLAPVLVLHSILLPLNALRLFQQGQTPGPSKSFKNETRAR